MQQAAPTERKCTVLRGPPFYLKGLGVYGGRLSRPQSWSKMQPWTAQLKHSRQFTLYVAPLFHCPEAQPAMRFVGLGPEIAMFILRCFLIGKMEVKSRFQALT